MSDATEHPTPQPGSLAEIANLLAGEAPNEIREGLLVDFSLVAGLALVRAVATIHPSGDGFALELIQQWRARVEARMGRAFIAARRHDRSLLGQAMLDHAERGFAEELQSVERILRSALLSEDQNEVGG